MEEKTINGYRHIRYHPVQISFSESKENSLHFYRLMDKRRSVREISDKPVSKEVIETIILTASTAPSGAHKQPWTFCAVSNQKLKNNIREAAEKEEKENYRNRMSDRWKKDLEPFATNWEKEFLTKAPWLIVVFKQSYGANDKEEWETHYYVNESVGVACGMLITAIHQAGLVTLTHTPSPMNFLSDILNRPQNERPFLLLPVGYPEKDCFVPDLQRKALREISRFYE